jgi:hypothetical protein
MTSSITTALVPDHIKKGDFITVLEWLSHQDNSYKGDVLEVQAINLPFIVCKRHTGYSLDKPLNLDMRAVTFAALSREYVDAAIGEKVVVPLPEKTCEIKENMYVIPWSYSAPSCCTVLVTSIRGNTFNFLSNDGQTIGILNQYRPATPDEIKTYLIVEAGKKGIAVGTKVKYRLDPHTQANCLAYPYRIDHFLLVTESNVDGFCSEVRSHFARVKRPFLVAQGLYQNPVDCVELIFEKPALSITVDGTTYTPKFQEGYVEFGCARIANETFVKAHDLIKSVVPVTMESHVANRSITSIRIGKGDFSPELIAGIVAEIEKRAKEADDGFDYYCHEGRKPFDMGESLFYVRWNRKTTAWNQVFVDGRILFQLHSSPHHTWVKLPNRAAAEALIRKTS